MQRLYFIFIVLAFCAQVQAQGEDVDLNKMMEMRVSRDKIESGSMISLQFYRYKEPEIYLGEEMWVYLMPELPVYPPMVFKSEKQRAKWNRMIANVKKTLPLAQKVKRIISETYEMLEMLPDEKSKDAHIKAVERDIKAQFTPEMKKLTFSQGKLLIKLVDRECHQSSYEIVQAFLGPTRAAFYQVFAWTFGASLKKDYRPDDDDKMVERIVQQIETGQL
ncbi:MAG: DUF4294 domain-containing protein [Bacteroidaceae bacterium]|nr:DUF4294 domain-containing protein [Bacteroidaceae bacterium]